MRSAEVDPSPAILVDAPADSSASETTSRRSIAGTRALRDEAAEEEEEEDAPSSRACGE